MGKKPALATKWQRFVYGTGKFIIVVVLVSITAGALWVFGR